MNTTIPGLVSIVIPCYKGEAYLAAAIESCLRQSVTNLEVIVVDDASPDGCAAIGERYAAVDSRVRVIRHSSNGGVSRAFNTGFDAARGEYFTRLAQDDLFREDAIAVMRRRLEQLPLVGLVYCDFHTIDEHGNVTGVHQTPGPKNVLVKGSDLGLCVMWRKAVWDSIGKFDPAFDTAEDYEYWLRLLRHFPIDKCPGEAPLYFRFHERMGSVQFRARQELVTKLAEARHCSDPVRARRLRGDGFFEAGYVYRRQGRLFHGMWYLLIAAIHDPFRAKYYRCLGGLFIDAATRKKAGRRAFTRANGLSQNESLIHEPT